MIFGKEAFTDELIRDPNIVSVLSTSEICVRGTTFAPWIFIRVQRHSKKWWWPTVDDNNTGLPKIQICLSAWWVLKHPVNKDKCSSLLHEFFFSSVEEGVWIVVLVNNRFSSWNSLPYYIRVVTVEFVIHTVAPTTFHELHFSNIFSYLWFAGNF